MSRRRAVGVLLLAAIAVGVALLVRRAPEAPPAAARPPVAPRATMPIPPADVPPEVRPAPPPGVELDEDGVPTKDVTIHALGPGDGTGVHAFPPPGTKPIRRGIVVPEDAVLPPGYLRHHQTTDDGDEVPPILVYDPQSPPLGPDGKPVVIPADRVVPPHLAPPGIPVELLDPPPVRADLDEHAQPLR